MKYRKLADLQNGIEGLDCKLELTPENEVVYREQGGDKKAVFTGSLVAAEPDLLVISVAVQEDEKHTVTGSVKLSGKWELDEKNRITFSVKRGLDRYDKLTFQGAWEVNDNFQVTYSFETNTQPQHSGSSQQIVKQELVFEGHWDISEKNCLTYLIGVDSESSFRFRGTFETKSILAKEGEICYQVGVEYELKTGECKSVTQTITLFGKWKLSDDLALSFELECTDGRKASISVGVELDLEKFKGGCPLLPDKVTVNLTSSEGDPLGVEIVLTKDLFEGNVQTFVRFRESLKETAVEAGITIPW